VDLNADACARMLRHLLPPSKLWRRDSDGVLSRVLLACGDELERVHGRVADLIEESDPRTAVQLLPDWERALGLIADGTLDERRARVVARLIARQRFRPADFQLVLAPLLGQAVDDVVVIETSRASAVLASDDEIIYLFHVYRDPGLGGSYDLAGAQAQIGRMKPTHTLGRVCESIDMICDDPFSLCDRDIIGA
jgi:uncharacterized protein YmfQ (DUF2313 family)